ncbi:PDR/VanB family oxidoreductase [Saccharopolyspora sp. NPDC049357]|uniref:PDR/VanB family oxidoreductase n=1 Tax=Saccharopolyspora sp. NPDC049357 TaxID=3154507 RepID=UPI003416FBBF
MTTGALSRTEVELKVQLDRKDVLAAGVVRLTLRHPDGGPVPEWEPGAHIEIVLRDDLVRQYSLCGDPADRSTLQVAVLREPDGRGGSDYVHRELAEGDLLRIRGPRNHFPLVRAKKYLFLAGGIGITPILPMIDAVDRAGADWRLAYGGRSRDTMAFADELVTRYGPRVGLSPEDETGRLDLDTLLRGACRRTAVYCCGPESLLAEVESRFPSRRRGALHLERFKATQVDAPTSGFEVELARSRLTLTVPENRSILEVAEDAGVPVLSSCQEGICGTCETPVLDGVPDHRDSLLTEAERAANRTMMICVSRTCGTRLILDL